ncbi:MAG: hypothetical protein MPW15_24970 [Candidatus Manganitrophus sp.]|nr:hypothetical protein [Candidatus Manganitrophus sp.]
MIVYGGQEEAVHFYKVAYRLGYATLAAEALGPAPGCSAVQIFLSALQGCPSWRTRFRLLANNVTGNTLRDAPFLIGISFASLVPA